MSKGYSGFSSKGYIRHTTYNQVRNKLGKDIADKFINSMNKGLVSGKRENGIKLISGNGIKIGGKYYKYEIKIKGKGGDYRIYGNYDPNTGQIIFEYFDRGQH